MGLCKSQGSGESQPVKSRLHSVRTQTPLWFSGICISLAGVSRLVSCTSPLLTLASAFLINDTRPIYKFVSEMRIGHFA